jgi:hypothetical protein
MVKDLAHSAQILLPKIIELRDAGRTIAETGRELGLTQQSVRRALTRAGRPH